MIYKSDYEIQISICENDDRGDSACRFTHLEVEWPHEPERETCLKLEADNWFYGGESIWINNRLIQVAGYSFKYSRRLEWAGNMHWNAYYMPCYYAIGLINLLLRTGRFRVEEGYTYLFDAYKAGRVLTMADFGYRNYPAWQHTGEGFHTNRPKQIDLFKTSINSGDINLRIDT